jgi:hypothetical protein
MTIYVPGKLTLAKDYIEGDRNFSNVSLLLHGDGTNGSTTIVDSSPSPKTVTAVGNAQISTAQSKFGGASIALDGNGDYLTSPSNIGFLLGAGAFTVEAWLFLNTATNTYGQGIAGTYTWRPVLADKGWRLGLTADGKLDFFTIGSSSSIERVTGASALSTSQWHHIAASRSGGTLRLFHNGSQLATAVSVNDENHNSQLVIGTVDNQFLSPSIGNPGASINGYIDDLRITKGIARYTSNFTPSTAPFADAQY